MLNLIARKFTGRGDGGVGRPKLWAWGGNLHKNSLVLAYLLLIFCYFSYFFQFLLSFFVILIIWEGMSPPPLKTFEGDMFPIQPLPPPLKLHHFCTHKGSLTDILWLYNFLKNSLFSEKYDLETLVLWQNGWPSEPNVIIF